MSGFYPVDEIPDVTKHNPVCIIYLCGDEFTDGSLRIIPDIGSGVNFEFQYRTSGVWNDTGIQIAASTIHLGRDLQVGGAGDWVRISDADDDLQALLIHWEYSDADGSARFPHGARLSGLSEAEVKQPDDGTDNLSTLHTWVDAVATKQSLIKDIHLRVGATAPVEQVTVTLYKGIDNTGELFFAQNYSSSIFIANTEVEYDLGGLGDVFEGDNIYHEVYSKVAFGLKGTLSGIPWHAYSVFDVTEENIATMETGINSILTSRNTGEVLINQYGNVLVSGAAP